MRFALHGHPSVGTYRRCLLRGAEVLTGVQRLLQRGIEDIGDTIPAPWGPRIEFVFREIGGMIWLRITLIVLVLRVALSTVAATWRAIR